MGKGLKGSAMNHPKTHQRWFDTTTNRSAMIQRDSPQQVVRCNMEPEDDICTPPKKKGNEGNLLLRFPPLRTAAF